MGNIGPIHHSMGRALAGSARAGGTCTPATAAPTQPKFAESAPAQTGISSELAQFLQELGGGLEDNQVLKTLIALLIVLAMLEQQSSAESGMGAAMAQLGQGAGGGGSTGPGISWSISVETYRSQSFTLTTLGPSTADATGMEPTSIGSQLDITS